MEEIKRQLEDETMVKSEKFQEINKKYTDLQENYVNEKNKWDKEQAILVQKTEFFQTQLNDAK